MTAPEDSHSTWRDQHRNKWHEALRKPHPSGRNPAQQRSALRIGGSVRSGVVAVCLALAAAGCSPEEQTTMEQPSHTVPATGEPEPTGAEQPREESEVAGVGAGWGVGVDWPRPPLAGMWVDYPLRESPSSGWIHATLSIEPPCAYLTNVSEEHISTVPWEGRRLALSLLYPEERFDKSSRTLWTSLWGYDIPISHGDRVVVSSDPLRETIGDKEPHELHLFWDVCPAHALASPGGFWTSVEWLCTNRPSEWVWHEGEELERICVQDSRPWNQRELLEQKGIVSDVEPVATGRVPGEPPPAAELMTPPFFDMHPYHPDMELELSKLVGILSIESAPPNYDLDMKCVYLYPTAASAPHSVLWGDLWKLTGPDGQPLAVRLDLPYPQARFDEETWTLWNGDVGPMTTGDRVIADPIAPPDFHTDGYNTRAKQPHVSQIHPCRKAGASAAVLDIQPVEHYCTHDPPARHRPQCEQAMSLDTQIQNHLTPPGGPPLLPLTPGGTYPTDAKTTAQ